MFRSIARGVARWRKGADRIFSIVTGMVPEKIVPNINPDNYGFTAIPIPPSPEPPRQPVRVYVAPVNFSGQGYAWARAIERLDSVGAVSMQYRLDDDMGFPSDNPVPVRVFINSRRWQRAQFRAVSQGFSHVLVEAERPIFSTLFNNSVEKEVETLRSAGVTVGMLSHGSDLRLPSRHRRLDRWSPFLEDDWRDNPILERQARANRELLAKLHAPVFVATPEQLLDWPDATWLPNVVDPSAWACDDAPLEREVPVVIHAPSNAVIKGTHLIEPIVEKIADSGEITYRRIHGVPASDMPSVYRSADIVLEQFRIGNYSTVALQAMAAGRVVVGHVHAQVRDHVMAAYGVPVPIVEATPDTLAAVIRDIVGDRARYRKIATLGTEFVAKIHDGAASARVLEPFLRS